MFVSWTIVVLIIAFTVEVFNWIYALVIQKQFFHLGIWIMLSMPFIFLLFGLGILYWFNRNKKQKNVRIK